MLYQFHGDRNVKSNYQLVALLALAALSAGCTISTGMRNEIDRGNVPVPGLEVIEVTPDVVLAEARAILKAAQPPELIESSASEEPYHYRLGVGDVIRVVVWEHPELNNPSGQAQGDAASSGRLIEPNGMLFFPYVGNVKAAGLTTTELRDQIARPLSRFIRDPQVDVRVVEFRSKRVYVTGEVATPGPMFLNDTSMGVLDAIALKGGFTELSNRHQAYLTRGGVTTPLAIDDLARGNVASDVRLQAGDLIHVPDIADNKIYLLGEFATQKTIVQGRGSISLAEALVEGGGLAKLDANAGAIFIFRRKDTAAAGEATPAAEGESSTASSNLLPKVYALDLTRAESLLLAERFPLRPHDVIYIASTDFSKYNRIIGQLLPTVSSVFQIDSLVNRGSR